MARFQKRTLISAAPAVVFSFHERPDALALLTPPWERQRILERSGGLGVGARTVIDAAVGPFIQRIVVEHTAFEHGRMFQDTMLRGPFKRWVHTHRFEPEGDDACWLDDSIEYELPFGLLGALAGGAYVRRKLERMFEYRHDVTKRACERVVHRR